MAGFDTKTCDSFSPVIKTIACGRQQYGDNCGIRMFFTDCVRQKGIILLRLTGFGIRIIPENRNLHF